MFRCGLRRVERRFRCCEGILPDPLFLLYVDGSEVTNARFLIAEEADVYMEQLDEGRISVPSTISVTPQGSFAIDGSTVTFVLGDQEVRMAALEGSSIQVEYFGLPRHPAEDPEASAVAAKAEVKDIPAAVVFRGDEEVGRIVGGDQWNQPEQSLSEVLAAGTGGP